jgi:hypothetical protein
LRPAAVTEREIRQFLEDNGYPAHVVGGGRDYLLRRYREFVDEVERGYQYGLHEYRHDLDLRGAIAMLGLDADVHDPDERLAAMLVATGNRIWESMPGEPFWDFGYPRNASGRLLEQLRSAGLAP